ncbi:uncharacterized protein PHACADRAFT_61701, partial [Phanerochaete carnosa HHB-10118-sp]
KAHYRVVFNELGHPLHDESVFATAFQVICDVMECLVVMHDLGWVYRDISTGNILVHDGRGLLTDLEYAQHWTTAHKAHTTRTPGTRYFMSVEANAHAYLFRHKAGSDPSTEPDVPGVPLLVAIGAKARPKGSSTSTLPLPFRYHPLNDWESL